MRREKLRVFRPKAYAVGMGQGRTVGEAYESLRLSLLLLLRRVTCPQTLILKFGGASQAVGNAAGGTRCSRKKMLRSVVIGSLLLLALQ